MLIIVKRNVHCMCSLNKLSETVSTQCLLIRSNRRRQSVVLKSQNAVEKRLLTCIRVGEQMEKPVSVTLTIYPLDKCWQDIKTSSLIAASLQNLTLHACCHSYIDIQMLPLIDFLSNNLHSTVNKLVGAE